MGHYTTCQNCGRSDKGYKTYCNCYNIELLKAIKNKIGATIIELKIKQLDDCNFIYEKLQKDDKIIYFCTIIGDGQMYQSYCGEVNENDYNSVEEITITQID